VVSLLLAVVGVYGVIAFHVGRRTHEIGVRMALGALVGILGAMATTRLLESWLYGVSATDPFTFVSLALVVIAVAMLACWIPARRAACVDPIASLRAE